MKNAFFLFFTLSLLLTGCKDNNEQEVSDNFIEFNDTQRDLNFGYAEDYGLDFGDGESFNIDLSFFNYDVSNIQSEEAAPGDLSGIYFEAFSPIANRLAVGDYEFSDDGSEFTFSYAEVIFNKDFFIEFQTGTLRVLASDADYYEVVFETEDEDGNEIYFEFKGNVSYADFSSKQVNKSIFLSKRK